MSKHTELLSSPQPRRHFIKQTSFAVGASLFAGTQLLRGRDNDNIKGSVLSGPASAALH
jgi:hypothetical protein